ncbi:hypothetical protein HGB13_04975, partial [bacterium]|nr:hypothetical protein [bacterium]
MIKIDQIRFDGIKGIDVFIATSGYEERASYQFMQYKGYPEKKIVLSFSSEQRNNNRKKNDNFFSENKFHNIILDGEDDDKELLWNIIEEITEFSNKNNKISIYIDYSCMTKNWYGYLLYAIYNNINKNGLVIYFGYSHAVYEPSKNIRAHNRVVG